MDCFLACVVETENCYTLIGTMNKTLKQCLNPGEQAKMAALIKQHHRPGGSPQPSDLESIHLASGRRSGDISAQLIYLQDF